MLARCKDFVCFQQNNLFWRDGTFSSEKNVQHSLSYENSIDTDVVLHNKNIGINYKNIAKI